MIRLVDGIGPFFTGYDAKVINWSKIPFENLEKDGRVDCDKFAKVKERFDRFARKAKELGFTAISLDDLAHLVCFDWYNPCLKEKIKAYQTQFRDCFVIAKKHNLSVFVTTDIMFFNKDVLKRVGTSRKRAMELLSLATTTLFEQFPEVDGIITRFGEADGVDVQGDFHSRLVLKSPKHINDCIKTILPVVETHDKKLIFRTWTTGASRAGDLMWNKKTYNQAFKGVGSDALIVSLKYGPSDFFRFLEISPLFFEPGVQKMVEFQTRREYEGAGKLPSFVGWEYERYLTQLERCDDLVGVSVWCQTGGWSKHKSITFLEDSLFWNELNTQVTARLLQGASAEKAIADFCKEKSIGEVARFTRFLKRSDAIINSTLYLEGFAKRSLFFRKVRVPPLLWVYWDVVLINGMTRAMMQEFHEDKEAVKKEEAVKLAELEKWRKEALALGLPEEQVQFQYETLALMAKCHAHLLSAEDVTGVQQQARKYHRKHPGGFEFLIDDDTGRLNRWLLRRLVRTEARYGVINWSVIDGLVCLALRGMLARMKTPFDGKGMTLKVLLQ